jgi:hypothetical protein
LLAAMIFENPDLQVFWVVFVELVGNLDFIRNCVVVTNKSADKAEAGYDCTCLWYRGSVRPLAGPIARRIIIANPDLASVSARYGASHFFCVPPYDLRIVPAHAAAIIRAVVVALRFRGPIANYFTRRSGRTRDFEQVLAIVRIWSVEEIVAREQIVGPGLG